MGGVAPSGWPVRALLAFAGADAVGSRPERVAALAAAIEMLYLARFIEAASGQVALCAGAFGLLGQAAREDRARALAWAEAIAVVAGACAAGAEREGLVAVAARLGAHVAGGSDGDDHALARFGTIVSANGALADALEAVSGFDNAAEPLRGLARRLCSPTASPPI